MSTLGKKRMCYSDENRKHHTQNYIISDNNI